MKSSPRSSSGQFFAELLLGVVLKEKLELQLRNIPAEQSDLHLMCSWGQSLTAPTLQCGELELRVGLAWVLASPAACIGFMLDQRDSCPVSWLVDWWCSWDGSLGEGPFFEMWLIWACSHWGFLSPLLREPKQTNKPTNQPQSCLPREGREAICWDDQNMDCGSDRPLYLIPGPAT